MKNKWTLFFLPLLLAGLLKAQPIEQRSKKLADSLLQELRLAKSDSTHVRLRYLLASETGTWQATFWDSLLAGARANHMQLYEARILISQAPSKLLDKGIQLALQGYTTAQRLGSKIDMIAAYNYLARAYMFSKGNAKAGLDYSFAGLKLAEEIHDPKSIADFNLLIGSAYWVNGEFKRALSIHLKCLKVYRQIHYDYGIIQTLSQIGTDYHSMNSKDSSAKYYLACKPYLAEFGKVIKTCEPYLSVASAYNAQKQYDSALKYAEISYNIAKVNKRRRPMIGAKSTMAGIYFDMGRQQLAKKTILDVLDTIKMVNYKIQILPLAELLHQVYLKEHDYKRALETYKFYISIRDSLSNETEHKQAMEKEFNYNLGKKESSNRLLAQENKIQGLVLRQDRYILAGLGIALVLLALVLAFAYLFFRQNRLRNEQKSAQLEQKLLRSQMNPHFIFNSLHAIQNFVLKEDKKQATSYLGAFADVMRNVLENSRMEAIPLQKETDLLKEYLELQKLRFAGRFDYEISIDETIDPETVLVPPMLAQPFIENAVEHGFHDIKSGGKILVSYTLKNDGLVMEITDNGTGMQGGYAQNKKHQSLAMEITKERVALMNKKSKRKAAFSIAEAFPGETTRKGVKVIFILPLS